MGICSLRFQQRIFFSELERGLNAPLDSPTKGSDGSDGIVLRKEVWAMPQCGFLRQWIGFLR